jgi:hypothetical protein
MFDNNRPRLEGISGADSAALADLWLHYGREYYIERPLRGQWFALRKGVPAAPLTARTPGEMRGKLAADRTAVLAAGASGG